MSIGLKEHWTETQIWPSLFSWFRKEFLWTTSGPDNSCGMLVLFLWPLVPGLRLLCYNLIYIWCGTIVLSDCWHDVLFLLVKLRHIANQHGNRTSSDFLVEKKPRSGNAWNWQRFIWKWGIPYTPKIHEVGKYVRKDCNRFLDVWEDWADHTGKFMQFLEDGDKQVDGDFSLNVWEGWVCKSLLLAILTITKLNSSLIVERTGANHTGKFNNTED